MNIELMMIAGTLSFVASALHIGVIFGGPNWYRFFGAGEAMAKIAEQGSHKPAIITLGISLALAIWGAYAWSAANILPPLPFSTLILSAITLVYLLRGLGGLIAPFVTEHRQIKQNSTRFWIWSSLICLAISTFHLLGLVIGNT